MYCNGCLNRHNHDICSECVGFDLYRSYVSSNPFLAIDIDDEMQTLANLLINIENIERKHHMRIKKVIFNYPATIVLWEDGTKTIVKSGDYDIFDPEKGLAMAIAKKALGNKGDYYEVFKKWLPEEKSVVNGDSENACTPGVGKTRMLWAEELAEILNLSVGTIRKRCKSGEYPNALKVGGKWQIPWTV